MSIRSGGQTGLTINITIDDAAEEVTSIEVINNTDLTYRFTALNNDGETEWFHVDFDPQSTFVQNLNKPQRRKLVQYIRNYPPYNESDIKLAFPYSLVAL